MTIKKFQGKTKEEAIALARAELGPHAVIMNVKEQKPSGLFGFLKKSIYEVTGAIEDDPQPAPQFSPITPMETAGKFNAVADEKITIHTKPFVKEAQMDSTDNSDAVNQENLRGAFDAVNQVIHKTSKTAANQVPLDKASYDTENPSVSEKGIEQRLDSLQNLLEKQLSRETGNVVQPGDNKQNQAFVKMLYNILLDNEVQEKYVNQILDDMEKIIYAGNNNLDYLISNVYQKMVLKLGQPRTIQLGQKTPKVVFFIGPTGVGKTTTIAKIASKYKVEYAKKVAMLTADTYRIAAAEQLRTYANILDTPLSIVYTPQEINDAVAKTEDYDLVLVDTAGFSHKNQEQREDMKKLLESLDEQYERDVYLVLSATTKYRDLIEITDIYKDFTEFNLIFTKLDETTTYGNIMNVKLYTDANLSYITTGQNVPDDMEIVDTQKMVKQLLGGH